jgi:hypothetical protein
MTLDKRSMNALAYLAHLLVAKKQVLNQWARGLYYKKFYGRTLWIFVISYSVCLWLAFPA